MRMLLVAAVVTLAGCAGMFHKPDVSSRLAGVKTGKVCTMNVLDTSIFDPVLIETCASTASDGAPQLVTRFGTMREATAHPRNWKIEVRDPAGEVVVDNSALEGATALGTCGTGGCSREGIVTTKLPRPWAKGTYAIGYSSKLPPVLAAKAQLIFTD
jgi:hypothetical protein